MIFLHRQNTLDCNIEKYGVEIDLRYNGEIVLNHDILEYGEIYPLLRDKVNLMKNIPIICNIKESGIEEKAMELLKGNDFYFLDSQIPDILRLSEIIPGRFIIRISDVESFNERLIEISKPKYVWIDYSRFNNFDLQDYKEFLVSIKSKLKDVIPILVSPELYNISFLELIGHIRNIVPKYFSICTKKPELWSCHV